MCVLVKTCVYQLVGIILADAKAVKMIILNAIETKKRNKMKSIRYFVGKMSIYTFLALFTFAIVGCDSNDDDVDDMPDIVQVATDAGFNTLVTAVSAADLVETLQGPGPFTVFAPTDAAFGLLPDGTLDNLLLPENQQALADILTYHVVSGRVTAADVVNLTSATTVQGEDIAISVVDGTVFLNGVEVSSTDVEASNGIIHIIEGVLLPPSSVE